MNRLSEFYQNWPFFTAIVNNMQREMARSELPIAKMYAAQGIPSVEKDFDSGISNQFDGIKNAVLKITGQESLLANSTVIQKSIRLRNPYTDVINLIQIELMNRWKKESEHDAALGKAILLSINGLAAAMQSTG